MSELKDSEQKFARVSAGLTYRQSLPGSESITHFISISDDARKGEKVGDAVDRVYSLVEKKLDEKIAEYND